MAKEKKTPVGFADLWKPKNTQMDGSVTVTEEPQNNESSIVGEQQEEKPEQIDTSSARVTPVESDGGAECTKLRRVGRKVDEEGKKIKGKRHCHLRLTAELWNQCCVVCAEHDITFTELAEEGLRLAIKTRNRVVDE